MSVHHRKNRSLFRFSGPDAQKLLHDVLTPKFDADSPEAAWWALLSPQGKVQAEGLAGFAQGAFWLDVHANDADNFYKRMRMYRLRADVVIDDLRATHIVGFSSDAVPDALSHKDARLDALGYRIIAEAPSAADWQDDAAYARARIENGIVEISTDFASDSLFPHDMGMDLLAGVDFSKGCYIGQEVVSRMQHRGTARRRPVVVAAEGAQKGDALVCAGRDAGSLGEILDNKGIGILRLDRIKALKDCTVSDAPAKLVLPGWASYDFADSSASGED
jgi:folate-binding protein YgfZ